MTTSAATAEQPRESGGGLSTRSKVLIFLAIYLAVGILLYLVFGSDGENEEFQPQEEFRLTPWIELKIGSLDLSINKAVLYLFLTCVATIGAMVYVAKRMQQKPNRTQVIVEGAYDLTYNQITRNNMDAQSAARWFPFVATLFFFIYQVEGIRRHGLVKYLKGWLPAGVTGAAAVPIFIIEVISQFVRIISLSVRLFANILAGHLLILFMGGGLAVLLGIAALGWITLPLAVGFFIFEIGLIATLQAFIFATLTSIYFGEASAGGH